MTVASTYCSVAAAAAAPPAAEANADIVAISADFGVSTLLPPSLHIMVSIYNKRLRYSSIAATYKGFQKINVHCFRLFSCVKSEK
jgi:hypothetical protein